MSESDRSGRAGQGNAGDGGWSGGLAVLKTEVQEGLAFHIFNKLQCQTLC